MHFPETQPPAQGVYQTPQSKPPGYENQARHRLSRSPHDKVVTFDDQLKVVEPPVVTVAAFPRRPVTSRINSMKSSRELPPSRNLMNLGKGRNGPSFPGLAAPPEDESPEEGEIEEEIQPYVDSSVLRASPARPSSSVQAEAPPGARRALTSINLRGAQGAQPLGGAAAVAATLPYGRHPQSRGMRTHNQPAVHPETGRKTVQQEEAEDPIPRRFVPLPIVKPNEDYYAETWKEFFTGGEITNQLGMFPNQKEGFERRRMRTWAGPTQDPVNWGKDDPRQAEYEKAGFKAYRYDQPRDGVWGYWYFGESVDKGFDKGLKTGAKLSESSGRPTLSTWRPGHRFGSTRMSGAGLRLGPEGKKDKTEKGGGKSGGTGEKDKSAEPTPPKDGKAGGSEKSGKKGRASKKNGDGGPVKQPAPPSPKPTRARSTRTTRGGQKKEAPAAEPAVATKKPTKAKKAAAAPKTGGTTEKAKKAATTKTTRKRQASASPPAAAPDAEEDQGGEKDKPTKAATKKRKTTAKAVNKEVPATKGKAAAAKKTGTKRKAADDDDDDAAEGEDQETATTMKKPKATKKRKTTGEAEAVEKEAAAPAAPAAPKGKARKIAAAKKVTTKKRNADTKVDGDGGEGAKKTGMKRKADADADAEVEAEVEEQEGQEGEANKKGEDEGEGEGEQQRPAKRTRRQPPKKR